MQTDKQEGRSYLCERADGSTFTLEAPSDVGLVVSFEDPPEGLYAPGDAPPEVVIYCKGVRLIDGARDA